MVTCTIGMIYRIGHRSSGWGVTFSLVIQTLYDATLKRTDVMTTSSGLYTGGEISFGWVVVNSLYHHYNDVIMGALSPKSPASRLFTQPFNRAHIKENIKAPRHWHCDFPAQMASNAESVSIWWRHHDLEAIRAPHPAGHNVVPWWLL